MLRCPAPEVRLDFEDRQATGNKDLASQKFTYEILCQDTRRPAPTTQPQVRLAAAAQGAEAASVPDNPASTISRSFGCR